MLPPSLPALIFASIRVFSEELLRWPKYWSFSFCVSLSYEYSGWFPLGLTGLISLLSKGVSRVFSSTTIWKHQFLGVQPSLWSTQADFRKGRETRDQIANIRWIIKKAREWKSWLKAQHSENKDHGIWSHHFMENRWRNSGGLYLFGFQNHCRLIAAMKLKDTYSLKEKFWPTETAY